MGWCFASVILFSSFRIGLTDVKPASASCLDHDLAFQTGVCEKTDASESFGRIGRSFAASIPPPQYSRGQRTKDLSRTASLKR